MENQAKQLTILLWVTWDSDIDENFNEFVTENNIEVVFVKRFIKEECCEDFDKDQWSMTLKPGETLETMKEKLTQTGKFEVFEGWGGLILRDKL